MQLQTVPLPTLVIVYAQLLSGCIAVLSQRVASRAVLVLGGRRSHNPLEPKLSGQERLPLQHLHVLLLSLASWYWAARRFGVNQILGSRPFPVTQGASRPSPKWFSASFPLVSVRRRRRRLEDTCAQKGGACPTNEPGVGVGCSFAGLWVVGRW